MAPARKTASKGAVRGKKRALNSSSLTVPKTKAQRTGSLNSQLRKSMAEVKSDATAKRTYTPDKRLAPLIGFKKFEVLSDYSCTLNQTNIGQNNNKFYVIQLIKVNRKPAEYVIFTRWGRVGETGQHNLDTSTCVHQATKSFKNKFKSKTGNNWDSRSTFTAIPKKYVLLDMADEEDDEEDSVIIQKNLAAFGSKSKLDYRTQIMIKLIFNDEMFLNNMQGMNLDVKKMPLGKLSKVQIVKGLECLLEIEKAFKAKKGTEVLMDLSSKFYTIVPHNFGRCVPEVMNSQKVIDQKKENMIILSDIELAQSMEDTKMNDALNEIDKNYNKLNCELELVAKYCKEYKMIEKYASAASCHYHGKGTLLDIWRVNRQGESERMLKHDDLEHRKLLWHGTNVAVIAAILKAGLRIMPHSGGRVGRGIYFASEFSKSRGYLNTYNNIFENEKNIGFMLLVEVALGNTKEITDGSCCQATAAPKGYNSIVARGRYEPDEKQDFVKKYDNHDVIIPYGKPKLQNKFNSSHYTQSEYLVYKESQAKIRYILKFSFA